MYRTLKIGHTSHVMFALLATTVITANPAAHAQVLVLGQSGSTTLSGTATLTASGATAGGIYSYQDGGTGVTLANQNNFDYLYAYGTSTANVSGALIHFDIDAYNSSTVNFSGGGTNFLFTYGTSTANVSGGGIGDLLTEDANTINVTGGSVGLLSLQAASIANVSSGGNVNELFAEGASTVNASNGGNIGFLSIGGTSRAGISGGGVAELLAEVASTATITGGNIGRLDSSDNGIIDLFGTGFADTLLVNNPGSFSEYKLTGTLQNGDVLNADYYNQGGTLEFNGIPIISGVPEASSFVSLGLLLLLGAGGVAVSRRRKAVAVR